MIDIDKKNNEIAAVSFDFQDTITLPVWSEEHGIWVSSFLPNEDIIAEMYRFKSLGWRIYIIYPSLKSNSNIREMEFFLRKHELKEIIDGRVVHSEGNEKFNYLKNIPNLKIHYDDEAYELELLPPNIMGVKVYHPGDAKTKKLMSSTK